jgi:hypothetical protein
MFARSNVAKLLFILGRPFKILRKSLKILIVTGPKVRGNFENLPKLPNTETPKINHAISTIASNIDVRVYRMMDKVDRYEVDNTK